MPEPPDPVPISALQHWCYCPRQCGLIHQEQVFADNVHTARGHAVHRLVDQPGDRLLAGLRVERALPLWSERLGLIGKADLVEFHPDGSVFPVEYKHGRKRRAVHDDLQLAAQAMCLEEMLGRAVNRGAIYHASSHRRREVEIDTGLRALVNSAAVEVRNLLASSKIPPPVNDRRCRECSLRELCQPELVADQLRHRSAVQRLFDPDADPEILG
jgi:CRISPR-associated exonuclease Cas4